MPPRSPATLTRDVGRRVAELRAARRWTQEAFAELAEVSVGYVRQVEGGRENLTIASLAKLAELLGVDAEELLVPPVSREAKRGRPRRSTERVTAGAAEVLPAGPTILDVETILGTEEELEKAVSLAAKSATAQVSRGVEWIFQVDQALHAIRRAVHSMRVDDGRPLTESVSDPESSRQFVSKLRDLSLEFLATSDAGGKSTRTTKSTPISRRR